jgi:hypothetical protein
VESYGRSRATGAIAIMLALCPAVEALGHGDRPVPPWRAQRPRHPAETPALAFELGVFGHRLEGAITSGGGFETDIRDDLGLDGGLNFAFGASFAHSVPWLPDVRFERVAVSSSGRRRLEAPLTFEGVRLAPGERVRAGFDASVLDLALTWRPLRLGDGPAPWLALRAGADLRHVDGRVFVESETTIREADTDLDVAVVPMLLVGVDLFPYRPLGATADLRAVAFGGSRWLDAAAAVRVHPFGPHFALAAGWRHQRIVLAEPTEADVDVGGLTAGAALQF